ncbi:MAG TPA: lanthionine synthetase LanC family protein [Kofleriaceae bacterium]|nr:lanthionine synthetase LanC family protein [Kofleriaceae bacterium]
MRSNDYAQLRGYVASYREAIACVGYDAIAHLQPSQFASIAFGGAGTAYALWRLGMPRHAAAWLRGSLDDRRRAAFKLHDGHRAIERDSYSHGRAGLLWLRNLIVEPRAPDAITAYVRAIDRVNAAEFVAGRAGHLTGVRLLLARRDDTRLRAAGEALASALVRSLRARAKRGWRAIDAAGFAHSWSGVMHALLAWHQLRARPIPGWLADELRALHAAWTPGAARIPDKAASWCNGGAGTLLLWTKAFELTHDDRYRDAARGAASHAVRAKTDDPTVCCGRGGVAFALLALARVDATRDWRALALKVAIRAVKTRQLERPNGLYYGHPGLVCLALDLLSENPVGFPTIEDRHAER